MKEIIELEKYELYKLLECLPMPMVTDDDLEKEIKEGKRLVLFGKKRRTEQVPESWEELIQLCKEINDKYYKKFKKNKIYLIEEDFIEFTGDDMYGFRVDKDGTLSSNDFDQVFKTNLTPAQMWQIIKILMEK